MGWKVSMKRVVMIAFDCDPYRESESLVAWNMAYGMSLYEKVTMITRPQFREHIEQYFATNRQQRQLKFIYVDDEKLRDKYERAKGLWRYWILTSYIDSFFRKTVVVLRDEEAKEHIDVIHRVTPNSYRKTPNLSSFSTSMRVMGPCGGAQETPKELYAFLTFKERMQERVHRLVNKLTCLSLWYRHCLRQYDKIICVNRETLATVEKIAPQTQCILMTDVSISSVPDNISKRCDDSAMRLLWAGRFIYRKGLCFLMKSLARIKDLAFTVTFVGDGEERRLIEHMAGQFGLLEKCNFVGRVDHQKVSIYFKQSDLFLFPSFRESSGNVLAEAMEYTLPVVAFNQGGTPVIIGDAGTFIQVQGKSPTQLLEEFSNAIRFYLEHQDMLQQKKVACREAACTLLTIDQVSRVRRNYE